MEIIRKNNHDYLLKDGNEIDLGESSELQPLYTIEGNFMARRHMPECGILNLRDMGGVKTNNGKRVAYHHFYRGAAIRPRSEEEKKNVDALKFKTIIDFRSDSETEGCEDYVSEGTTYYRYSGLKMLDDPKNKGNFDFSYLVQSGNIRELKKYMIDMYKTMAIDNPAFKVLMNEMKEGHTPLYFHCTAGKDRTGVGAALILLCLGVDEEDVYEEYLLSNVYRKEFNEYLLSKIDEQYREDIKPLYYVHKEYLKKTIDEMKRVYGSLDNYFEKEHGLTKELRKQLQEKYCI